MVAFAQTVHHSLAGKAVGQHTGQPAVGAQLRNPRMGRAGPPLVAVGIGNNPDPVALLKRVVDQPFERAPGGMHLDGAFQPVVVGDLDVGVAPADVGEDDAVLVLDRLEQVLGRVGVGVDIGQVIDQGVG